MLCFNCIGPVYAMAVGGHGPLALLASYQLRRDQEIGAVDGRIQPVDRQQIGPRSAAGRRSWRYR